VKKIVVVGTGRMGGAFATAFAKRTSHAVSIRGSHAGSSSAAALSRQLGVRVADDKELLAADVTFVATPPAALDDVAAALKGYEGIIVSAMVPGAGGYELKRDDGTSAAEQLARLVPKGRVVTAFTSISSALIREPASGEKPTVFTCADDEAARSIVIAWPTRSASRTWMPAILTLHATSRTSPCSWDSLLTDQASETALRCALM
jgi:8-hydroxy-5-deazaflavin:NADPH oxidoreductase